MNDSLNMSDLNAAILAAVVHEEKVNYPVSIESAINISIETTITYVAQWLHETGHTILAMKLEALNESQSRV